MDFTKTINKINSVTAEALIQIPVEQTKAAYELKLKEFSQKANLKGFRPGKAPRPMIENIYGGRARLDAIDHVARQALSTTISEMDQADDLIGQPELDFINLDPAKPLEFKATVYFYPRPQISGYDSLSINVPELPAVGAKEVDEAIRRIAHSKAKLTEVERDKIKKGDVIVGVYQDREGDSEYTAEEKINIPLGDKFFPEELEKELVGKKKGESFEITIAYPENSDYKLLAGKTISYRIRVDQIMERELPEMNEQFIKDLKFQETETIEQLREKLTESIERENKRYWEQSRQQAIIEALLADNQFDVPKLMVQQEIKASMQERGGEEPSAEAMAAVSPEAYANAERQLRGGLLLMQIARQENLFASREDLQNHVQQVAAESGMDIKILQEIYLNNKNLAQSLQSEITTKKVFDFLITKVTNDPSAPKKKAVKKEVKETEPTEKKAKAPKAASADKPKKAKK